MNTINATMVATFSLLDAANTAISREPVQQLFWRRDAANDPRPDASKSNNHYTTDHRIAKLVVCLAYILLGAVSIESGNPYIALVAGTCIWFFGINAVGYLIESLRGHRHTHQWV